MDVAWFLIIAPLAATIAILLHLHKSPGYAIFASVGSASLCFFIALLVFFDKVPAPTPFLWIDIPAMVNGMPNLQIDIGMIFDPLSKGMLLVVTGVGLLVHIFSIGYMAHDKSKGRFFGGLSIFMFSMTGIVLSDNLVMMFIFWEGVGFSSYLLVGFWYERESAAQAANKAFVCNRLADFGFMLGIMMVWFFIGTVTVQPAKLADAYKANNLPQVGTVMASTDRSVEELSQPSVAKQLNIKLAPFAMIMVFCLFCGCIGKSAMVPLHVWLPDAMEGPTPVSALIHAATMVAAGIYMLCRVYPLLMLSSYAMFIIACVGCFTAIFAALIATQQNDIKRILAYSTLSQLGYMVMAVGCGGPDAAMFHLTTHAFFKALLFLAAGSVIHALHEEQDIWRMGGLFSKIPLTAITFLIGMLALSGFPPFAGFVSKDYLLSVADRYGFGFYLVGVITAFLTAFYMTRLVVVAFFGNARTDAAKHPHESPAVMTVPLVILAVLSVIGGYIGFQQFYHGWSSDILTSLGMNPGDAALAGVKETSVLPEWAVPLAVVVFGILSALFIYWGKDRDPIHIRILAAKFYIDEFYDRHIVGGQQLAAQVLNWIDRWVLDGLLVRGSAYISVGVGELLRLFQTGSLQGYAFIFTIGTVILVYFTLFVH